MSDQPSYWPSRRRIGASAAFAVVGLSLLIVGRGHADSARQASGAGPREQDGDARIPRVWIYKDVPAGDEPDSRSDTELYFNPFLFFPESAANKVAINTKFPSGKLDPGTQGTCVEIVLPLEGVDSFAGVGWIPGDKVGAKPAFNIAEKLLVGFGRPVVLKFRARTARDERASIRFEACGFSHGDLVDGIRPSVTPRPDVTDLTDRWQTVTVDLTKKSSGLESVACPLKVIAKSNENPRKQSVTVFVDDLRYEVGPPPAQEGK